jgi:alkylation response protein AidB-like acyl-CoA dehydrogenase
VNRTVFEAEHEALRRSTREFFAERVVPFHPQWEKDGIVDRAIWTEAGKQGLLGLQVPEEYGGGGTDDFRFNAVLDEEITFAGATGLGFGLHNDISAPYLLRYGTDEQKQRWLPGFCTGEIITAIAMTEPGAGSDLQGIRTTAVKDGSDYIVNGSKTFITNGIHSDLVIVVAKTDTEAGHQGISLIVLERGMPGFERGRNLDKIGLKAQDTAELSFTDVRVPQENLLGEEGKGFIYLMENLPQERLCIALVAVAAADWAVRTTTDYVKERKAFGKPIGSFQNTRFTLAEAATEVAVAQAFVDKCLETHVRGELTVADAAMAKWWATEMQKRVIDTCLQMHGGYGYMSEYPIARAYLDTRVQTIYGGTTEIMKEIIGRTMGL